MSRVVMTALAEAMFGFDAEHIPAYVNDDMVAARLLEFLGGPGELGQAEETATTSGRKPAHACAGQAQRVPNQEAV